MEKIKISAVNYLNTVPFIDGLKDSSLIDVIDLELDYPAQSAYKLEKAIVNLALVPVAILKDLPDYKIISDYCIASNGPVTTVKIFSDVPISDIETIFLDYQSRTSVQLCKILIKEYWQVSCKLEPAFTGFQKEITGTTAGLVIGDRAIRLLDKFPYQYDLSEAWKSHTSLPFVFACWVSLKEIDPSFIELFNNALSNGLEDRQNAITSYKHLDTPNFSVATYLKETIRYKMNAQMKEGLSVFLSKME